MIDRHPPDFAAAQLAAANATLSDLLKRVPAVLHEPCRAVFADGQRALYLAHLVDTYRRENAREPMKAKDAHRIEGIAAEILALTEELASLTRRLAHASSLGQFNGYAGLAASAREVDVQVDDLRLVAQALQGAIPAVLAELPRADRVGLERALAGTPRGAFASGAALFWRDAGLDPRRSSSGFSAFVGAAVAAVEGADLNRSSLAEVVRVAADEIEGAVRSSGEPT